MINQGRQIHRSRIGLKCSCTVNEGFVGSEMTTGTTPKGQLMFVPLFRRHTAVIKRAFQDVSFEEMQQLERVLKKISKRAEGLAEKEATLSLDK